MVTAAELYAQGQQAQHTGRLAAARALLERARGQAEEPDLRARIALSLAYITAETGTYAEGMAECLQALAITGLSTTTEGL
ncbi:MAG: hypothetical protein ACJ72D_09410, partial [Marmoricola sp.]